MSVRSRRSRLLRRSSFRTSGSVLLAVLTVWGDTGLRHNLAAQPASVEQTGPQFYTGRTQRAVQDGLKFLAARQQADGSFGTGRFRGNVAVTALAGMAFLAGGHTPGRGKYGKTVQQAVEYLLARTQPNGYIVEEDVRYHGPMYGHGFATMFLAECYGMMQHKTLKQQLRTKLKRAVSLIIQVQNKEGGWRYKTDSTDADISVTVCQVMALRASRNAGIYVPKETIQRALRYIRQCQNRDGGFRYQTIFRVHSAFPRSAAAVAGLYSLGLKEVNEGPEIQRGLRYLKAYLPRGGIPRKENHYFYGHYYAAQAMWHAGGQYWRDWYPAIRDELLADRETDGRWRDDYICDEYGTAMALLILQMPVNYLPIFQR